MIAADSPTRRSASNRRAPLADALIALLALTATALTVPAAAVSPPKLAPDGRTELLTQPSDDPPLAVAADYLATRYGDLGLTAADVATLELEHHYVSDTLGTNVFYQQQVAGIPVWNGITSIHVLPSGAILAVNNTAVADLANRVSATEPSLSAADAYAAALAHLGVAAAPAEVLTTVQPERQGVVFTGAGATRQPVPVRLSYVPRPNGQVRLAWELFAMTAGDEVWYLFVDAADGSILEQHNLVTSLNKYRVYGRTSESPISTESPTDLGHDLFEETGDLVASPIGWHSGSSTTGNNVEAVEDRDDTNTGGFQPTGTGLPGSLVFDFAHDDLQSPCEQPTPGSAIASNPENLEPCDPHDALDHNTNLEAAVVNLFYWNNLIHDVMVHYGFTEGAGNFQQTNFTNEGFFRDFDAVFAQAQDGSGTNNANFFTPPDDGITPIFLPPAMQMYEWSPPAVVTVNAPADFMDFDDGDNVLSAATASFGATLRDLPEADRTGDLELGDDGSTGDGTGAVNDGCEPLVGFTPGRIALLDRGFCEFGVKVLNAENAGAKAVVIANTLGREVGTPMGPGAVGDQVTIPSVMIGESNGTGLKQAMLAGTVNLTLEILPVPNRDSDFDNGVIAHEYGHGISNRLVGGPTSIACLINAQQPDPNNPGALIPIGEQMGEGWSDFFGLMLTAQPDDTADTPRGVGAYISFQGEDGPGIRRFPYSRDTGVNPFTYGDVAGETAPHGVGTVWATMIWDLTWNLIDAHGFEPDLFQHTSSAGNVRALRYVNDGLVLTKCRPSFVDGRNAILLAEAADGDTEDECLIWRTFARRGLGLGAVNPTGGEDHRLVVEDFTVPPHCAVAPNNAPEAVDDSASTLANTAVTIDVLANDSDPDGDPLSVGAGTDATSAEGGTVTHDGAEVTYDPPPGFTGTDSFDYQACDDGDPALCDTATVTVTVEQPNRAPEAADDSESTLENTAVMIEVLANDSDPDGDPLSVGPGTDATSAEGGTVTNNGADVTYDPPMGFSGTDSFDYQACDDGDPALCDTATVTVTVVPDPEATEGRVHGSGHLNALLGPGDDADSDTDADSDSDDDSDSAKVNFSFDAKFKDGELKGKLKLKDKELDVKIEADKDGITSLSTGSGDCNGQPLGPNSWEFTAVGSFEQDDVETEGATFRVCGEDNGEPGKGNDRFYLECTSGCSYDTGSRVPDDVIDGGNIHIHDPIGTSSAASGSSEGFASKSLLTDADVLELEPLLLDAAPAGSVQLFVAALLTDDGLNLGAREVTLTWTDATGVKHSASSLTDGLGVAAFWIAVPAGGTELFATSGGLQSNGAYLTGTALAP